MTNFKGTWTGALPDGIGGEAGLLVAVGEPELLAGTAGLLPVLADGAAPTGVAPGEALGLLAGELPGCRRGSMSA